VGIGRSQHGWALGQSYQMLGWLRANLIGVRWQRALLDELSELVANSGPDPGAEKKGAKRMSKVCPECGHAFQGNGWDGIDAHWRAAHETIMPYEMAWPLIQAGTYQKMPPEELDDPESSYRRGYQQGAWAAMEAVKSTPVSKIRTWIDKKLHHWRYRDRVTTRFVRPPTP
jgi:hypothetical protein